MPFFDIFGTTAPSSANVNLVGGYILGMKFMLTSSTVVPLLQPYTASAVGVKFYKTPNDTGPHSGSLFTEGGTLLASCSLSTIAGAGAGWLSGSFDNQVTLSLDTIYVVSTHTYQYAARTTNGLQNFYQPNSVFNPLISMAEGGLIKSDPVPPDYGIFPDVSSNYWYGIDIIVSGSDLPYSTQGRADGFSLSSTPAVVGYLQGINVGGPTTFDGSSPFGRHYQVGATQSYTEGNPTTPCLQLTYPGMWRFRWIVQTGARTISVSTKQNSTGSYRPKVIVKANSKVGLNSDLSGSASDIAGWTTIGPLSFTATGKGAVWVELWNKNTNIFDTPCFFDHIVTS